MFKIVEIFDEDSVKSLVDIVIEYVKSSFLLGE